MLRIEAQRRTEEKTEEKGYTRQELRYGSFTRTLALPDSVSESDIQASYKDGILEIRVPVPPPPVESEPKKIAINKG
jgi:HSP20 family protein